MISDGSRPSRRAGVARRVASVLSALSLASATPALTQQLRVPVTVDTLPNGLTLIVHEDHSAPVVAVNMWYHVGSGDEKPGRTGFAHLFEHLMFMGSQHAPYPEFDRRLEAAGANNNGSTTEDRTNYFEEGPANALPLMLWLEADRMGWLLPTMDSAKVDLQRDVVKNERRQGVENQPYGLVEDVKPGLLFPKGHPYSWPVIGSMADLSAASLEDVKDFFRRYYAPNNASLVVAGDVRTAEVRELVQRYFGAIPRGPAITRPDPAAVTLARDTAVVLEDRVQLPRLYLAWPSARELDADDPALTIAAAKNARLTQPLVYEEQLASNIAAYQDGRRLGGEFDIVATARPGHDLGELQVRIDAILRRLADEGPTAAEMTQARTAIAARVYRGLEQVGRKADRLNAFYYEYGVPDAFEKDLDRLRAVTPADVQRVVSRYLLGARGQVSVVPQGRVALAAPARGTQP
jgi:zinc protease